MVFEDHFWRALLVQSQQGWRCSVVVALQAGDCIRAAFFFPTTRIQWQPIPIFNIYYSSPLILFVWTSAWKNVKHLKMLLGEEKKSMYVTFTWQPSKVVKSIRTRRPLVCLAVICSWSPQLPTTPWVSCIMQQQFWLKSKNLLTECSVRHLGRCLINYYNWHPHQMSDIWRSLCW